MGVKSPVVLIAAVLIAWSCTTPHVASTTSGSVVGGYTRIDPNIPIVVENAKFAVQEHNNVEHTKLEFQSVVSAEQQIVAGYNYRLSIVATDNGTGHLYLAIVYVDLRSAKRLKTFGQIG